MYDRKNIIIWHDVINNSLSKHRSNSDNPLTRESIIEVLKEYKNHYQPLFTYTIKKNPNVYRRLVETGIKTTDVTKHLISKSKANDKKLICKLKLIHPPAFLELKKLSITRRYFPNLSELIEKIKNR